MRLQKYLAYCGVGSRRKCEDLIKQGKIKVNGKIIITPGYKINPEKDFVKYNEKIVKLENKIYIVLNKPKNYICSTTDEKGRKTVIELLKPKIKQRIYPVGRLDFDTTGCLILTNDGEFAEKIMHPKYGIEKKYILKIKGRLDENKLLKIKNGIKIEGKLIKPKEVKVLFKKEKNDIILITVTEGMNHLIKKICETVGLTLIWLKRDSVGIVTTKGLEYGEWRFLTKKEIDFFKKINAKVWRKK